jgi:hypothetical protein
MNKKMLVLFLMFSFSQVKPIGIIEVLALIGCGAIARTKPAHMAARYAWSKFSNFRLSKNVQLPASNTVENCTKIDQGAKQRLEVVVQKAKQFALQNKRNLASVLATMKNRLTSVSTGSVKQTETTIHATRASASYAPPFNRATAGSDQSASHQFTQVHAQKNEYQASGLFPRITNNYYSGKAGELVQQINKKRFWQGAFCGSLMTAWMLKPTEPKKDKAAKA